MTILILSILLIVIHIVIGHIAAIKMMPKVAEICSDIKYQPTECEYTNGSRTKRWVEKGWVPNPKKGEIWRATGKTRGEYTTEFHSAKFKYYINGIRWMGILYIPLVYNAVVDEKAINKFDPKKAELKQKKLEFEIEKLQKQLDMK